MDQYLCKDMVGVVIWGFWRSAMSYGLLAISRQVRQFLLFLCVSLCNPLCILWLESHWAMGCQLSGEAVLAVPLYSFV